MTLSDHFETIRVNTIALENASSEIFIDQILYPYT